jgi:hypothetical protein
MITNISWAAYFYTAALLMVLWYLFIGFRYFYADIKSAFGSRFSGPSKWDAGQTHETPSQGIPAPHLAAKGAFEENSFNDFDIIEEVVDRVKTLISTTIEKSQPKSDFLLGLYPILKDYPALKSSQFRPSINEFVTTECEAQGLENVTTEEVENCWNQ